MSIRLDHIALSYGSRTLLDNVSATFEQGQLTALIGRNGTGKSTLLRSLNRMNDLVEGCRITGDIQLDGQDIYKNCDVNLLRRRVNGATGDTKAHYQALIYVIERSLYPSQN